MDERSPERAHDGPAAGDPATPAGHAHDRAPASGSDRADDTELSPEEEPRTTGTLFLVMIVLMIIVAVWLILYLRLLDR